ncbi:heterokaryon incompatibility protein-domain-containing protein [Ilyonectria sp. MPI-CAGE-AT-0026]|nr:heterokaryon incompatibility protein-domain-containing protein [Ilyonectria sp. MPI-CAGE-AT-0026]
MRLLELQNSGEFSLTKDLIDNIPPYAILSHTWGADIEEVSFQDLAEGTGKSKLGYEKIRFCGNQARLDGLLYIWVDTCCIDKSNNTELSEAINSMFHWYHNAAKCYVYLSDVSRPALDANEKCNQPPWERALQKSRWFTRGWTLQELIAPTAVEFFSKEGQKLGDKRSLERRIHEITGIPVKALQRSPLSDFSVAERMSWTEKRETTRKEDKAYSLLGIFDLHMPLIYGEGRESAFKRLRKEIQYQAEEVLPTVNQAISDLSAEPIRRIHLMVRPETMPQDPDIILELRLKLDQLFHGTMSFFIARYQEGRTWPDGYGFSEPDYTEFFLSLQPRFDVQFRWFDRIVRLGSSVGDTVCRDRRVSFGMTFDGEEFKPRGSLSLPQLFEIPSLHTLIKNRSRFQLVSHNVSAKVDTDVPDCTAISIEIRGEVSGDWLQLYRSHTTKEQRDLLTTPYLSPRGMSPILRNALLARYCQVSGIGDSGSYDKLEIPNATNIEKNEFDSEEERLQAASYLYNDAGINFRRSMWRDAYRSYQQTSEVLWPLISSGVPSIPLATALYVSVRRMVQIWQRQKSFENAKMIIPALIEVSTRIKDSDSTEPDFQRMWADALQQDAVINAELQNEGPTIARLVEHVEVLRSLYISLPTRPRKLAWLDSLLTSVKIVSTKNILADKEVETWKAALEAETGDDEAFNKVARQPLPGELPVWLKDCTVEGWPTKPIKSATLRYSLRIPERWSTDKEVRGTASQTEHVYHGGVGNDSDWLIIGFQEDVNEYGDLTGWVTMGMIVTGFPVLCGLETEPELLPGTWQYMGQIPNLGVKLKVDEVHGYMGVAKYKASPPMLGRVYVLLLRKGRFAWNIALSFRTACLPGTSGKMLDTNDHNRAGAILGTLKLGDV